jgi:hypothetical protein
VSSCRSGYLSEFNRPRLPQTIERVAPERGELVQEQNAVVRGRSETFPEVAES